MANLFKNILDSLKLTEDEDNEDYDDYVSELEERERKRAERQEQKQALKQEKKTFASRSVEREDRPTTSTVNQIPLNSTSVLNDARKERVQRVEKSTTVSKVVPLRSPQKGLEVCIMKPTSFEDSQDICDMLLSGRAAVINLEGFDVEVAQRVMDFVSGAVYAMNGKLHQISSYIFIISPDTVDISGDYLDLIRQNGFEVPTLNKDF
ncbi:cell division protein SepF [Clostridium sp. Marseille-P299]|uniref:cell division protein SepF n=1 Tax=Clostridium sp. Marseille-P299 TaxID=1805477 RepID=UPI000833D2E5|nr:cell division protein SepF [Clostridium sp. Marseille-P299]